MSPPTGAAKGVQALFVITVILSAAFVAGALFGALMMLGHQCGK